MPRDSSGKRERVPNVPGFYRTKRTEGWVYEFRVPGETKWTRVPGNPGEQEAKRWRNKFLGTEEVNRVRPSNSTFHEVSAVVMDSYRRRGSTKAQHEANLRGWLTPLARIKVQEIDKHTLIQRVVKPMEDAGLSGSTIHNTLNTASLVFEAAIDARLITLNPVKRLKSGVDKPSREPKRKRVTLSADQFARLLENANGYKALLAVMGLAGLRLSEALGLTWADVRFDTMQVSVEWQLAKEGTERMPLKTKASKGLVDMSPMLAQMLATHSLAGSTHPDDFVFVNSNGRPYSQRAIGRALAAACVRADVPVIVPHELRHTCGSALLVATRDPAVTCKQMRHGNPQITLTVYAHEWGKLTEAGAVGAAMDASLGAAL